MLDGIIPPFIILAVTVATLVFRTWYTKQHHASSWIDILLGFVIISAAALLELKMGRVAFYKYGPVRIWSGNIWSDQNSQQITDPYTFTHITHGILFYGLFRITARKVSLRVRALLAISMESAWEVFENTAMVINHYRAATISLDYFGDSVINSVFDILACLVGFILAGKLPITITLALVFIIEIMLTLTIRDSLFLNMVMLAHPIRAIKIWQLQGAPLAP